MLDVGDVDAVALTERAGLEVDVELRYDEERQALRARARTLGTGEDEVNDVVGHVVLGAGDESLDALDVPRAVRLRDRLGPAGPDVGAGVGLGEHHGRAPPVVDHQLGDALLVGVAEPVEDRREARSAHVEEGSGVGAEQELGDSPAQGRGGAGTAEVGGEIEPEPLRVHEGSEALLERLGHRHRVGGRIEDRRVAVGVGEAVGERALGEPGDLVEDAARCVCVHLREGAGAHDVAAAEDLEEGELDVAEVAPVVTHGRAPSTLWPGPCRVPAAASLPTGNNDKRYWSVTPVATTVRRA